MRTGCTLLAALCVAAAAMAAEPPVPGGAGLPPMLLPPGAAFLPMEVLVSKADCVVIATVAGAGKDEQPAPKAPNTRPAGQRLVRYKVELSRVLKQPPDVKEPLGPGDVIDVLTHAPPSVRPPTAPPAGAAPPDAPAPEAVPPWLFARLEAGKAYVLLLARMPEAGTFLLSPMPGHCQPADEEAVERVERALNLDKWNWGEEAGGLRLALLVQGPGRRMPDGLAHLQVLIALRNVSKEPIRVNLYPPDKPLSMLARTPEGRTVLHELYDERPAGAGRFGPRHVVEIAPGEVGFVAPQQHMRFALHLAMRLTEGDWLLQAGYRSDRQAEGDSPALWMGKLESPLVPVKVKKFTPPMIDRGDGPMPTPPETGR